MMVVITMFLGILSRKFGYYLPAIISIYAGDTLWALMVYLGFACIINRGSIKAITIISLMFSYGIEISQLYQSEWINNIRSTTLGSLVLGHGFLDSDLVCYTIGVIFGILVDKAINKYIKFK